MDAFEFRNRLIREYASFSRSFTSIRAQDIRAAIDDVYRQGRYWPRPLIQISPNFHEGPTIEEMALDGALHPECARIFRKGKSGGAAGATMRLHKHQEEAIACAHKRESYVLTTGTGSGKSLAYFVPIVDAALQAKATDPTPRTRAIIIYPMNALANSQSEALRDYLQDYAPGTEPVTFGRYTGQEEETERQRMASHPPDILLTNFMMLELLMTRQDVLDRTVMGNAAGLEFLVLDELHTYRGRQGADVAMLVRRVREALNPDLLCIGTSATMASEGSGTERARVVAEVAGRLFGTRVSEANVITETLRRVTPDHLLPEHLREELARSLDQPVPEGADFETLRRHPFSVWLELTLSLRWDEAKLVRARPLTVDEAAEKLARDTARDLEHCRAYLSRFLLAAYACVDSAGRPLFAFRLHQFISGAGQAYATLEAPGSRYITTEGQQFVPGERGRRLFNVHFCRECGQEYHPVWDASNGANAGAISPRDIDDKTSGEDDVTFGYFTPDPEGTLWSPDRPDAFPETWLDPNSDFTELRRDYRRWVPRAVTVSPSGELGDAQGLRGWLVPGNFRFCLHCGVSYAASGKDSIRLASLSGEGRSSATTVLTLSALRYLFEEEGALPPDAKKILGFTDNRQDAALQSGHFNDFLQVLILRSGLIAAMARSGNGHLGDSDLTQAVFQALQFDSDDPAVRAEYTHPDKADVKGAGRRRVEETLRDVLGYRLYYDLRRGWRFNNPNLEQLGILQIDYEDLETLAADEDIWAKGPPMIAAAGARARAVLLRTVLDAMRRGLCIRTRYLDAAHLERLRNDSFNNLREPWGFADEEELFPSNVLILGAKPSKRHDARLFYQAKHLVSGGSRSMLARELKRRSLWGEDNPHFTPLNDKSYPEVAGALLEGLVRYGLVDRVETEFDMDGYQVSSACLQWHLVPAGEEAVASRAAENDFFNALYRNVAQVLSSPAHLLYRVKAAEHTAQVDGRTREEREEHFRSEPGVLPRLPILFCSPTMELGVDIAWLNMVYLRNVPPTPANYAQRSGRAGRSGQPAFIVTYCAAQSPHDQYFFQDPKRMVHGQVNPPNLDLANRELLESHLSAVWLAETGQKLDASIKNLLDMSQEEKPLLPDLTDAMDRPEVTRRAHARAVRIMGMVAAELPPEKAPWHTEDWVEHTVRTAFRRFHEAFSRWRELIQATNRQMNLNHAIQTNHAASPKERREAKQRYDEAARQQALLLADSNTQSSDFYTYRYLAGQGFLPGYNFPRLPLMAYVPAQRARQDRANFITRPRFLAISEFGPFSLIYHEGALYKVHKAILNITLDQITSGSSLATTSARLCSECGYGHFGEQLKAERCIACDASLDDAMAVTRLYRIENVSTKRAERITADQEERIRQGYEMQTTLQFAVERNAFQRTRAVVKAGEEALLELQYANAATVWRMNLGWRRRKEQSIHGFFINPMTGHWQGDPEAAGKPEATGDAEDADPRAERIVPFVEDRRNLLIVRPLVPMEEGTLVALQYALKRGIETEFQLEESELAGEPLPRRDKRRSLLFYEAAEGGAGVLSRLVAEPDALARVARRALEICHFIEPDGGWDESALEAHQALREDGRPVCEAGCYRCLLSYYNQPDHELVDRLDQANDGLAPRVLVRLTRSRVEQSPEPADALERLAGSTLERAWLEALEDAGLRRPDRAQVLLPDLALRADFVYDAAQALVLIEGPHEEGEGQGRMDEERSRRAEDAGWIVVRFGADPASWPDVFREFRDVFGEPVPRSAL